MLITDPAVKKAMDRVSRAIESQLLSAFPIGIAAIPTAAQRPSLTHLCPPDDAWAFIPDLRITSELVPLGEEGADITIELISNPDSAKLEGSDPHGPH